MIRCFILLLLLLLIPVSCFKNYGIKNLPKELSNNAVALIKKVDGYELYTFNGLTKDKTSKGITNDAFRYKNNHWQKIVTPNGFKPVLASTSVSIGDKIYVIGGYTVSPDGSEKSVPHIFEFNSVSEQWNLLTQMPVPVDDTVALVYAKRYIYLISGWHDTDNVSLIQVYDTLQNTWFNATHFPAASVFGHAGGIIDNTMIICDGVKVVKKNTKKSFVSSPVCIKGVINSSNLSKIEWAEIEHHSGVAFYRMAASGYQKRNQIVFVGGSDNPYNYDGIGYNEIASSPSNKVFSYHLETDTWQLHEVNIPATMDHRALLNYNDVFFIIGGMKKNQMVSSEVYKFKLSL